MSYEKKHGVGNVVVDTPYAHFIHELPLLSFGDVQHNINVSLIFQTKEQNNLFSIASGFKLNLQKRIIMSSEGVPEKYEDGNGKRITLNNCNNRFVLTDGSQRIIRPVGTTYVLENSDYSREVYENTGRIKSVWDKYGNRYLNYEYADNKLSCVQYRNKTVKLNYNVLSGLLNSLKYICNNETICTTTFSYPEEGSIIVHHYSGMDYHLSYSSSEFEVCSIDTDEVYSNQKPHRLHCKRSIKSLLPAELNFVKKIGSEIIDETTYNCYICDETTRFDAMDVTDYNGVKTRIQFDGEKPIYSYEVRDDMFREDLLNPAYDIIYPSTYFGTVTYYSNGQAAGIQEYNDGIKLAFDPYFNNWGTFSTDGYDTTNIKCVVLSGWLRREQDLTSNQLNISYSDMRPNTDRTFDMGELPLGRWVYFSKTIETTEIDSPVIEFDHYWDSSKLLTKDFRITPYYENTSNNASRIPNIENFLVLHDANGNETCNIPLNPKPDKQASDDEQPKTTFYNGDTELDSSTYQITVSDIIRYKINQAYGAHLNEIYYNNCCALIPNAGALKVKYSDANGPTPIINVQDAALETRRSVRENVYTTRIKINSNADTASGLIIQSIRNGHFYNQDFYDVNYLDLKSSYKDEVNVFYGRNNYGLITYQRISNNDGVDLSYTRTEYDPDCTKVVKTVDEFDQVTTYVTDDVWGVVTEAQLGEEGTAVKNTYDGDMSAILAKRFVKGDAQRVHTFDYSKGYCSEISDGVLTYNFEKGLTDTAEEYSNVSKCNRLIESYTRNPRTRDVIESFPNADDPEYLWYHTYDVYGKVTHVGGAFTNKYDVAPECRQGDACATGIDNASSKLASSKDLKTGKETKYAYEKGRVSKVGVFDSTDTMIEEETYTYDMLI